MDESIDRNRRRFLRGAAMTVAAAHLGIWGRLGVGGASGSLADALGVAGTAGTTEGDSGHLAALGRAKQWLNSSLSTETLRGKVVLVQFGTYTCINWLRTLPYIRAWVRKYTQGLIVIGVHTPEFAFERDLENVRRAVQQLGIDYPIAIDNDYAIWRAFSNRYWPALYFLDSRGRLRQHHFGEGEYAQSEMAIQRLLAEAGTSSVGAGVVSVSGSGVEAAADWGNLRSPEIYLGYDRTDNFSSPGGIARGRPRAYAPPARLGLNHWALAGEWTMADQPVTLSRAPGVIVCRFHARDVHLVMGPLHRDRPVRFRVSMDGQRPGSARGLDVDDSGSGTVAAQRLYQLVRQPGPIVERTLEVQFLDAGVEAFAFTFG